MNIENDIIQQLINAILVIIPLGGAVRVIMCATSMMHDEDKKPELIRRMKNTLAFVVFSVLAVSVIDLIYQYYG